MRPKLEMVSARWLLGSGATTFPWRCAAVRGGVWHRRSREPEAPPSPVAVKLLYSSPRAITGHPRSGPALCRFCSGDGLVMQSGRCSERTGVVSVAAGLPLHWRLACFIVSCDLLGFVLVLL